MNTAPSVRKAFRVQRYRLRREEVFSLKSRGDITTAISDQFSRLRRESYAKGNDEPWVTIGGSAGDGGKKHVGGTPVQFGEGGKVTKGPASLKGKTVDEFSLKPRENKESVPKHRQPELIDKTTPSATGTTTEPMRSGGMDSPSVQSLPDGRKVGLTMLGVGEMSADPSRFQYKISGIGDEGVTEELKEVDKFRPEFAGQLLVWHDPKDENTYVINGHHRYELAQRSGFEGQIPTYLIDAKDEREARALGALANIAEGRGTSVDAAKFFRESGMTIDGLKDQGVSMKGKMADEGVSLSKLSDNAFRAMVNDQLTEKRGLAITRHLGDHDKQDELLQNIRSAEQRGHNVRDDAVSEMARDLSLSESVIEEQTDLFGTEEVKRSLVVERGIIKASIRRAMSSEAKAFTEVGRRGRSETLTTAGNVIDTEGNRQRAQAAQQQLATFDRETKYKGEINDVINEYAGKLASEPKREKQLSQELRGRIRSLLSQADGGAEEATRGAPGGNPGNREADGSGADRAKFGLRESLQVLQFSRQVIHALKYQGRDDQGRFAPSELERSRANSGTATSHPKPAHSPSWAPAKPKTKGGSWNKDGSKWTSATGDSEHQYGAGVDYAAFNADPDGHNLASLMRQALQLLLARPVSYAAFREEDHPRAADGKFGSGGRGSEKDVDESKVASEETEDFAGIYRAYPPANPDGKDTEQRYLQSDGAYTPERQRLHQSIIGGMMEGVTPSKKPTVYMMGGGTASGKSSIIRSGLVSLPTNAANIDPDEAKSQLPEYQKMTEAGDPSSAAFAHEESSRISKSVVAQATESGFDVVVDGTGDSGIENFRNKVRNWRKDGHRIVANYATIPTETAVDRATKRGERTGRVVPTSFIENVHRAVSQIVPQALEEGLFDEFQLFDNSGKEPQLVVSARGKEVEVHDQKLWDSFVQKGR